MSIWNEKCDDRVGCDGGGCQEYEGRRNATTSKVIKVGFLAGVRLKELGSESFTDLTK
jgi:hypothetical protein